MTYVCIAEQDGTTTLTIDFADEGVQLTGETSIKGGEASALTYLPTFELDLRRNFSDKFPVPEVVIIGGMT